jgi:nucleoside phosphorylase
MICIFAALKREIDSVLDLAQKVVKDKTAGCVRYLCSIHGLECCVVRTGMGEKKLDPSVVRGCSMVVSTGFCGSLVPRMKAGDIVISKKILYVDKNVLERMFARTRTRETSRITEAPAPRGIQVPQWVLEAQTFWERDFLKKNVTLCRGTTLTVARVIRTREQKTILGNATGAISVEMEDVRRMKYCSELGVPFFSVRAVLDGAEDKIPGLHSGLRLYSDFRVLLDHLSVAQRSIALFFDSFFRCFPREPNFS